MKKIFSILVMAVAAFTMVSCGGDSVNDAMEAAANDKDVTRLVAIGDSIANLGDKADGELKAEGVISYATAYGFIAQVQQKMLQPTDVKGFNEIAMNMDAYSSYIDNFIALYESAKNDDAAKAAFEAFNDQLKTQNPNASIETVMKGVQGAKAMIEQAKAAMAAQEGEAAEGEEEAAEGEEEPAEE